MRVLHVLTGISRQSGGPSRSVQGLVAGLNAAGIEAWLMTLVKGEEPWVDGVIHFINGESFEVVLGRVKPDVVHLHCIWSLAQHRCAVICRKKNIPYVIAPRGMLEPWSLKQKWLKKRIARFLYQDRDLKYAAALHATAESEAEQFRRLGFGNPVIVSPNGVNTPGNTLVTQRRRDAEGDGIRRVLFVSRMHPKKGVMELVEAWNALKLTTHNPQLANWTCELVYTVSGETEKEYEAKVKERILSLGMSYQDVDGTIHASPSSSPSPLPVTSFSPLPNFIFTGALNDDEKWKAYSRADLFVLPTYSENFGIVVAEALWAGVPVITTKGTPWGELETKKCGRWIEIGVDSLVVALREMMMLPVEELWQMGLNGRRLVEEKYTWEAVVKKMLEGYGIIMRGKGD